MLAGQFLKDCSRRRLDAPDSRIVTRQVEGEDRGPKRAGLRSKPGPASDRGVSAGREAGTVSIPGR